MIRLRLPDIIAPSDRLLVCVSGGADSVCLLRLLHSAGYPIVVAHCNFRLRGAESDGDEFFVRNLAHELNLPIVVTYFDTRQYAESHNLSIEMAARELRYNWFEQQRVANGCSYIAIAHNLNDAAETFFINLVRGTGLKGLTGMRTLSGRILRPMLDITRSQITDYLTFIHQPYRTDSTNSDTRYRRNRIRHNILPEFIEMNPSFLGTMRDTMENLRSADALISNPESSDARLYQLYLQLQPLGFNHDTIRHIWLSEQQNSSGKRFESSLATVIIDRGSARVYRACEKSAPDDLHSISIEVIDRPSTLRSSSTTAYFDAAKICEPLTLRHWHDGDWFIPYGMKGRKKISDYLTDLKLNIIDKQRQLILVDSDGNILWVVGQRTDNRFAAPKNALQVAKISIENK